MVGSTSWRSEDGELLIMDGVFKLNYANKNSTIFSSFAKGTLESLSESNDRRYFETIKIVSFPAVNDYDFKLINDGCLGGDNIPQRQSLSLQKGSVCSSLSRHYYFPLQYASESKTGQKISPFERDIAYLPPALLLNRIQCFEQKEKVRYLLNFSNRTRFHGSFYSKTVLIGEGSWDKEKNQLCIVACRILHSINPTVDDYVDDCSTRLTLSFPGIWNIKNTNRIVGQIWTNKTESDPGYFKTIRFKTSNEYVMNLPGRKYVYTQVGLTENSCSGKKPAKGGNKYPNAYSSDMSFDLFVELSAQRIAWGRAAPISVSDDLYQGNSVVLERLGNHTYMDTISEGKDSKHITKPMNISYKIGLFNLQLKDKISSLNSSISPKGRMKITAEGVYDPETGTLCMVACRELLSHTYKFEGESLDCEILVHFEFPPLNSKDRSIVEGYIQSKREKTDPLYFEKLKMSSASFYRGQAKRSAWRIDLEITMVLIANTLVVVFVASQLFYVSRHPEKLPFISLVMLTILTLSHLIPLVLNFEALLLKSWYQQNVILRGTGWLEVNEISVRLVTMVAFILLFRLLQLAWTARFTDENGKASWKAEKHALLVSLPVYIIGGLISLFVNWHKNAHVTHIKNTSFVQGFPVQLQSSTLKQLRSYAGLILDGYLFPQILFNLFHNSKESPLSPVFYIGTTLVRLLPHAYDVYRMHSLIHQDFGGSYIYANHSADFYSMAWDVIIPCICLLFAVIIALQQRFGSHCIVPKKLREVQLYERVPVESIS